MINIVGNFWVDLLKFVCDILGGISSWSVSLLVGRGNFANILVAESIDVRVLYRERAMSEAIRSLGEIVD